MASIRIICKVFEIKRNNSLDGMKFIFRSWLHDFEYKFSGKAVLFGLKHASYLYLVANNIEGLSDFNGAGLLAFSHAKPQVNSIKDILIESLTSVTRRAYSKPCRDPSLRCGMTRLLGVWGGARGGKRK